MGWDFDGEIYRIKRNNDPTIPPYKIKMIPTKIVANVEVVDTGWRYKKPRLIWYKCIYNMTLWRLWKIKRFAKKLTDKLHKDIRIYFSLWKCAWQDRNEPREIPVTYKLSILDFLQDDLVRDS